MTFGLALSVAGLMVLTQISGTWGYGLLFPGLLAVGLSLALIFRVAMLAGIAWFVHLTTPIFSVGGYDFSWRDLVLIAGGLFLLVKGTREIHEDIEGNNGESGGSAVSATVRSSNSVT